MRIALVTNFFVKSFIAKILCVQNHRMKISLLIVPFFWKVPLNLSGNYKFFVY